MEEIQPETSNADPQTRSVALRRPLMRRLLIHIQLIILMSASVASAQLPVPTPGRVRLNNGVVLRGIVSYTKAIDPLQDRQNLELRLIDQGFRRYYVATRVSDSPVFDQSAVPITEFAIPQKRTERRIMPHVVGLSQNSGFDNSGQATITLRMQDGSTETVRVGITAVNSLSTTVTGLTHDWSYQIATASVPDNVFYPGILSTSPDFKDGGSRLNMAAAMLEATKPNAAGALLDSIVQDFPDMQPRVSDYRSTVFEYLANLIVKELTKRNQVGQITLAAQLARLHPQQDLTPEARIAVRALIDDNTRRIDRRRSLMAAMATQIANIKDESQMNEAQQLVSLINREIDLQSLNRFSDFEVLLDDDTTTAQSKIALAVSGFLMGGEDTVQTLAEASGLLQIRQLLLDYANSLETDQDLRYQVLEDIRKQEGYSIERVALLIRHLPSPDPLTVSQSSDRTSGSFHEAATDSHIGFTGSVPPEYSETATYPLIIAFPREGLQPDQTLDWWQQQAERNGYIVVVPQLYLADQAEYLASADAHRQLLQLIRRLKCGLRIDDDRVFIAGHGIGGEAAADFTTSHPDLFAGVALFSSLGRRSLQFTSHNCPQVPWYIVLGERQAGWHDRMGIFLERILKRDFRTRQIGDVLLVRYPNRGFESYYEETPALFDWLEVQRRAELPSEIRDVSLIRSSDTSWYWLELDQLPDSLAAMDTPTAWNETPTAKSRLSVNLTDRNAVRIISQPADILLKLSPEMPGIDLQKTIVVVGGRHTQRIDYSPSLKDMLDEFRATGERRRLCYMKVRIPR
jgi:predicted esterase